MLQSIFAIRLPNNHELLLLLLAMLEGIALTFTTGSDSALFYEILEDTDQESLYMNKISIIRFLSSITLSTAIYIGSIISERSFNLVYLLTAASYGIASISMLYMIISSKKKPFKNKEEKAIFKKKPFSIRLIKENITFPPIFIFVAFLVLINLLDGLYSSYFNFNQIIFDKFMISIKSIGLFYAFINFFSAFTYPLTSKLCDMFDRKIIFSLSITSISVLYFILAYTTN